MTTLPSATDWHAEMSRLEGRLLAAWCAGPSFRGRWTPDPREFFTERHRAVASACVAVNALGSPDPSVAIVAQLHRSGDLKKYWKAGDAPLPIDVVQDPEADLGRWRDLRIAFALRQRLVETLSALTLDSPLPKFRSDVLEAASQASVSGLAKSYTLPEGLSLAYQAMSKRDATQATSGYAALDGATGGLRRGHVWVMGAPTNWGKSSWLLSIADRHMQTHGRGVLMITCEDEPEMLFTRWLCRRAQLPGKAARDGVLDSRQLQAATDAIRSSQTGIDKPVMLDGRGRPVERLAEDIRAAVANDGIGLVLVDYLQCIATTRESQDRRNEINHIARTLTDAIKTCNCAGVLSSQLSGEDIRESRDVEHAAEVVLIGKKSDNGELSLFLKKNKTGPSGFEIPLTWDDVSGTFREIEDEVRYGYDMPYTND